MPKIDRLRLIVTRNLAAELNLDEVDLAVTRPDGTPVQVVRTSH
jgi:hypothetical protein